MPELTPDALTNIESGRRQGGVRRRTVSVDELAVIANALGVPPVVLVAPVLSQQEVQVLPGDSPVSTLAALEWWTGLGTPVRQEDSSGDSINHEAVYPLTLLQCHFYLVGMRWECVREMKDCIAELAHADDEARPFLVKRQDNLLCRLEGLDYDILTLRQQLREREYPLPPLPGEMAHLDRPTQKWTEASVSLRSQLPPLRNRKDNE